MENPGQFKKGEHGSLKTEFIKGQVAWNKDTRKIIEKECVICRGVFNVDRFTGFSKKTCSKKCGGRFLANINQGKVPWNKGKGDQNRRDNFLYQAWRLAVYKRDNYTCQICLVKPSVIHADHIEAWSKNEVLRYEVTNGRTLCRPCHYYVSFKKKLPENSGWALGGKAKF